MDQIAPTFEMSVKKADWVNSDQEGAFNFVVPAYGHTGGRRKSAVLPYYLPDYNRYSFYTQRDWTLMQTPEHEGMWANTIAIATTKAAAWGWGIESSVPLRQKRAQELLNTATAGTFMGYVPFISAHLRSYLTVGRAHFELERERHGSAMSRIVGIHHLNPLRCRMTDDPKYPVEYLDRSGKIHRLAYWEVVSIGDQVDATEGEQRWVESAAERAYDRIVVAEAVMKYLYEKVTGNRATSIEFIQGITRQALRDAIASSDHDNARHGAMLYKGVVAVPIPGDVPVQRVSIPIAEIPDGFDAQGIRDDATIIYAGSTGMDVNDIDPRLAQRSALGSGAQAVILDSKTKGKGLAAWRVGWTNIANYWILDTASRFVWSENSLDDDQKKASLASTSAGTAKTLIETQILTAEQAKNLLVDNGVLPREFLPEDKTLANTLASDEKPATNSPEAPADPPKNAQQSESPPEEKEPEPPEKPAEKAWQTAVELVDGQSEAAKRLVAHRLKQIAGL